MNLLDRYQAYRQGTRGLRIFEWAFAVVGLLLLTEVRTFPGALVSAAGLAAPPTGPDLLLWTVFVVALLILVRDYRALGTLVRNGWPIFVLVLLALSSALWSVDAGLSASRTWTLAGTTVFGAFLAARFSIENQIHLVAIALGVVAAASMFLVIAMPEYGILRDGPWMGIFIWKNYLGRGMTLATLALVILAFAPGRMRTLSVIGVIVCVTLVFGSQSRTSLLTLVASLTTTALVAFTQHLPRDRQARALGIFGILIGFFAIVVLTQADYVLAHFEEGNTLNNRIPLWSLLLEKVWLKPWFGYGYGSFWRGQTGVSGEVAKIMHFYPNHAHNGFLEIVLDLGIIGLGVFCLPFVSYVRDALRWALGPPSVVRLWPITYLIYLLLINQTYSVLMWGYFNWALYVAVVLSVRAGSGREAPCAAGADPHGDR